MNLHRFDKPLRLVATEELQEALLGQSNAFIIRSMVINELDFLSVDYDRSLRSLWYSTVKPALSRLGVLMAVAALKEDGTPSYRDWYGELSRYFGQLVDEGFLSYRDIRVIDGSRPRDCGSDFMVSSREPVYSYKVADGINAHVVLCFEKDTVSGIVENLATILGCSWICGKGQNAKSATEDLLYQIGPKEELIFLSITDYDPSGYFISDTFAKQAEVYSERIGFGRITSHRLGILPTQLTEEEVEQNKYSPKMKDEQREKWMELTGGDWGLELDAFTPRRLREVFIQGLKQYVSANTDFVRKSYIRKKALEILAPVVEAIVQEAEERFEDAVTVKDFDLFDLAADGYNSIPLDRLCDIDAEEIVGFILERFN